MKLDRDQTLLVTKQKPKLSMKCWRKPTPTYEVTCAGEVIQERTHPTHKDTRNTGDIEVQEDTNPCRLPSGNAHNQIVA